MSTLALDGHKLLYHLDKVCRWERGEQVYPMYLAISMSEACNHGCVFCVYDYIHRTKSFIDKDAIIRFVRELAQKDLKAAYFSGEGEPLMHPDAVEIITATKQAGVDCGLNSNGYYLSPDMSAAILPSLTYARFSINGCTPENYKQVHRTSARSFNKVMENLQAANRYRKDHNLDVTLGAQCVVLAENIDLIPELVAELKRVGIDYLSLKPFLPFDLVDYRTELDVTSPEVHEKLRVAEAQTTDDFKVVARWDSIAKIGKRTYEDCYSVPFMVEVAANGETYLCGVLLGREGFSYGNIKEKTYEEILKSKQYKDTVDKVMGVNVHKCMPNCRNDAVNRFLWDIKHPPKHVNFI